MTSSDPKMRCNGGTSAQLSAPVEAGTNVTAVWKQWTHAQGPVMVWLYKCAGEFSGCTGDGKGWFKIDQMGLYGSSLNSDDWGTGIVLKTLEWSSAIPKNIAPGNYLIRHELLALHQANTPQFYPECAQIVVSGSGDAEPPADYLFSIPTYAPQSDPGIMVSPPPSRLVERRMMHANEPQVDIYQGAATTYTPPAGPVWEGFNA